MNTTTHGEGQTTLTKDHLESVFLIIKEIRGIIDTILPTEDVLAKLTKLFQEPSFLAADLETLNGTFYFSRKIEEVRGLLLQTERACGWWGEWIIARYMELEQEKVESVKVSYDPRCDFIKLKFALDGLRRINIALEEPLDLAMETMDRHGHYSVAEAKKAVEKLTQGKDMFENTSTLRSFTKKEICELVQENLEMCNTFLRMVYRLSEEDAPAIKALGNTISTLYTPLLTDQTDEEFLRIPKVEIILHKKLKEVVHLYMKKYAEYDSETLLDLDVDDVLRDAREWENRLEAFNWAWVSRLYSPDKKVL